jgi:Basic region leucine zipper
MMQTRKRSFEETPATPSSEIDFADVASIEPSMLHLPTPESYTSSVSSPSVSECSRPQKKQRTRRNAKTEEEKTARAEERAVRNRKAAQESRDRRKRQYDLLEVENTQLRKENELLKQRLDALEGRITTMEVSGEMEGKDIGEAEVGSDFVQTHYPAVVMSYDQQCHTISLPPPTVPRRTSPNSISRRSYLRPTFPDINTHKRKSTGYSTVSTTMFNLKNLCSFPICRQVTFPSRIMELEKLASKSCATSESLNTGSLDFGAEMKMEFFFGDVFLFSEGAVFTGGNAYWFELAFVRLVELLADNEEDWAEFDSIYRWKYNGCTHQNDHLCLVSSLHCNTVMVFQCHV